MVDKILEILKIIEPIALIVIPAAVALWVKFEVKIKEENKKIKNKIKSENKQKLSDWRHTESIRVTYKLKEICNYYRDVTGCHASFFQLENGTIATSKLSNMFFSCIAEDNRYSNSLKLSNVVQRVPFVKLSTWFEGIYHNSEVVKYMENAQELDDLVQSDKQVKSIMSGIVKNPEGVVIGVCNLTFENHKDVEDMKELEQQMIKFISSVETTFMNFNIDLNKKINELDIEGE